MNSKNDTGPLQRPDGSLISFFSNRVKKEGGINLAQGTPGFPPPQALLNLLASGAADKSLHQYAPGNGNFQLLELIRDHYNDLYKDHYTPVSPLNTDNLLVVQGATEGIFLTFFYLTTILEKPFSALSFDPVYESYPQLARMFGVPFHYEDFQPDFSIDFERLERVIEEKNVKVLFIASPGNPMGRVWTKEEMEKVVELSRRYGFYIIFDAVYKELYFDQPPFNPLSLQYEKLFYIDSFSKTLSITGWRIGYIITSRDHMKKIRAIHDYTGLCAPSVLQTAIARYLADTGFGKEYIQTIRGKCRDSFQFIKPVMAETGFSVSPVQGGYFLWAQLPEGYPDAFEFAVDLYEKTGVAVVPGENFSLTKTNYIRMNIGTELSIIKEAAQRMRGFFK